MRVAALPTFRKPYRIVQNGSLPAGSYQFNIQFNFPPRNFQGNKRVVLTSLTWLGGKNDFLGITYITVGSFFLMIGAVFAALAMAKVRYGAARGRGRRSRSRAHTWRRLPAERQRGVPCVRSPRPRRAARRPIGDPRLLRWNK